MKQLSTAEFVKYMKRRGKHYICNPRVNVAFRCFDSKGVGRFFAKGEGEPEREIEANDEDFNEAMMFSTIMSKQEYDNY